MKLILTFDNTWPAVWQSFVGLNPDTRGALNNKVALLTDAKEHLVNGTSQSTAIQIVDDQLICWVSPDLYHGEMIQALRAMWSSIINAGAFPEDAINKAIGGALKDNLYE